MTLTRLERFCSKVEFTETCWLWKGAQRNGGYGAFWDGTHLVYAHRWAYEFFVGLIPKGLTIDHIKGVCGHRNCVNPEHLEAVTFQENMRRSRPLKCIRGHRFTKSNTILRNTGGRRCRTCTAVYNKNLTERRRT